MAPAYTVPGLDTQQADDVIGTLDHRLVSLIDLSLTLKHVHWNVVGRGFIAVHEMLDTQVTAVRTMTDEIAERIASLGGTPVGTPGALITRRTWDDYGLGKATTLDHLVGLNDVYTGIIEDHRKAQERMSELDPVSEDMLIGHLRLLEKFQWFIRAHFETADGKLDPNSA